MILGRFRRRLAIGTGRTALGYLFAAPLLVVLTVAVLLPALYNTGVAFFRYNATRDTWRYNGFDNFVGLFQSDAFWNSFWVTLIWVAGNVGLQLVAGFWIALALNRIVRFRGAFSAVLLIPWVSSFVVVAVLFLWIYHPQLGVLNDLLLKLGLVSKPVAWLSSPELAQVSLIMANSWKFFPLVMITLFTGLQDVPGEVLEAAEIDGAGRFQTLWRIVVPLLAPSIATAVLLSTIWGYNSFTLPIIMTAGGPLGSTEIMGLYIYKLAFDAFDFGGAAAASIVLFVQILAMVALYLRFADRELAPAG
ncbi:carbohydrate ABC transporter membrane protein 1 (CUT1 family) [Stella humosa]|uniref:Carbohydrate ABC transporter membrane protein 1 (CUT1 family) n=1 Tax=Stella humosa TaxID=94 RepID=A0A3N1KK96_9PROT|nr:sugar ABC transporter permease [Stella humosa]ROP81251.1 carbohydrate ABC transporter membrane protein 1 (CUT1 family) [Stella humosa]BBK32599.1 transporter [Stella humosa]